MADIEELKQMYFVQTQDANPPSEPMPNTYNNCKITPIIDGASFNIEIDSALESVGTEIQSDNNKGHFILIANWCLGLLGGKYSISPEWYYPDFFGPSIAGTSPYTLDPPINEKNLLAILKEKGRRGVDVRVLGWVSYNAHITPYHRRRQGAGISRINTYTIKSINALREEPTIRDNALLNLMNHPAGSVHTKMIVIGNGTNAVGFTGGLDLVQDRYASPGHAGDEYWHDVVAKVEGSAVQGLYDHFRDMWNENLNHDAEKFLLEGQKVLSREPGTTTMAERALITKPTNSRHHVQTFRTVPKFNINSLIFNAFVDKIEFAPEGIFSYKLAIQKAILSAKSYIYIEDQYFWSQEVLLWINEAIKKNPLLRVILVAPGGPDPNDEPMDNTFLLHRSINEGLLIGLSAEERNRIALFVRVGDEQDFGTISIVGTGQIPGQEFVLLKTSENAKEDIDQDFYSGVTITRLPLSEVTYTVSGNPPISKGSPLLLRIEDYFQDAPLIGTYKATKLIQIMVHAKTIIVDDQWAAIGTANIARRSLYTDVENGVSFIDEDGSAVRNYRCNLWADHFRIIDGSVFSNIEEGLNAWNPDWGTVGATPERPVGIKPMADPPIITPSSTELFYFDSYTDCDSREPFELPIPFID